LQAIARALKTSVSFLALTTDNPAPDIEEAAPVYFSAQADEAAQLIDAMKDDDLRDIALDLLRVLALHDIEGDTEGAPAPGTGGRLILGKLLSNLKKSSGVRVPGSLAE
jgi:hypothetical protein